MSSESHEPATGRSHHDSPATSRVDPRLAAQVAQWRRARREVIRDHHPDRGGDPEEFRRLLDALDRTNPERGTGLVSSRASSTTWDSVSLTPHSAPVEIFLRATSRSRRRTRRVTRKIREQIPTGWPGSRRYLDL